MKQIEVDKIELAKLLYNNSGYCGSTEWDVYIDEEGTFDIRHNTYDNSEWYYFIDMYYVTEEWLTGFDDEITEEEVIEWFKSESSFPSTYYIPETIEEELEAEELNNLY